MRNSFRGYASPKTPHSGSPGPDEQKVGPVVVSARNDATPLGDVKSRSAAGIFTFEPLRRIGSDKKIFDRGICYGEMVRLRHAMTGRYLRIERKKQTADGGYGVSLDRPGGGESSSLAMTAFTLLPRENETTLMGCPIDKNGIIRLSSGRFGNMVVASLDAQLKASTAVSGEARFRKDSSDKEDSMHLVPLTPTEEVEFLLVRSLKSWAWTYCSIVADLSERDTDDSRTIQFEEGEGNQMASSLAKIYLVLKVGTTIRFICGGHVCTHVDTVDLSQRLYFALTMGSHDVNQDPFLIEGAPKPSMQAVCRDGALIDDLMAMAIAPMVQGIPITFDQTTTSYSDGRFEYLAKTHQLIVKVLTRTFLGELLSA